MKILIVDDIKENLMLLRGMLESRGFTVEEAINGAQALDLARAAPPDLIISDIMMPEMDGFTLCRVVKGIAQLRHVPFVFYTATYLNKEDEMLGLALGASRYIHKPVLPKKFLSLIDEVISEHGLGKLTVPEALQGQDIKFEILHQERLAQKLDKKVRDVNSLRQQQTLILDSVLEGILAIDLQGKHFIVNNAARHLLGYQADELVGVNSHSLWHHSKANGEPCTVDECQILLSMKNGNRIEQVEDVFWRKDGSSFPVQFSSSPLFEAGLIQGVVVVFHDITERKLSEQALIENEEKFRAVAASAQDAIIMLDSDGNVRFWNAAAQRIFAYKADEVEGRQLAELIIPEQYRDAHIRGMADFKVTGEGSVIGTTLEIEAMRADGSSLPVELSISAVTQGGENFVVGFVRDITERKKNLSQLETQLDELRRWQEATLGREGRSLELKREINELLIEMDRPLRYPSAEEH